MLINELSKKTGISIHTIRFYEKSGLIKGIRKNEIKSNNYFHYNEEIVEKLELIRDAKSIGFTISEIGELMDAWYTNKLSVSEKLIVLDEKLIVIKQKIKEMKEMKRLLQEFKESVQKKEC